MKRCMQYLPIVLALFIFSFLLSDIITAQKKPDKNSYNSCQKSTSSKNNSISNNALYYEYERDDSDRDTETAGKELDIYAGKEKNFIGRESGSSENYFHIDKSGKTLWDGKHWGESNFPLSIYVKESSSPYYKTLYEDYVKYAMDVWRKAEDRIQYNFVKSIDDADIAIIFIENLGDKYEEDYLGLTDYDTNGDKQIKSSKIQISLIKNGNENISDGEIKATIIHELGHAFGLGHSNNKNDLMYPYISPEHTIEMTYDELSRGDKLAIKDVINLSFENNYVWK